MQNYKIFCKCPNISAFILLLRLKCAYEGEGAALDLKGVEARNRDLLDCATDELTVDNRRTQVIKDDKLRSIRAGCDLQCTTVYRGTKICRTRRNIPILLVIVKRVVTGKET